MLKTHGEIHHLTKKDIQAIKKADHLCNAMNDGKFVIRCCIKEPYNNDTIYYDIPTVMSMSDVYNSCFFSWHSGMTRLFQKTVKENDNIMFYAVDNGNDYVTNAGLYHDVLYCSIKRITKSGKINHVWENNYSGVLVADSITPNNTARALKG